MGGFIWDGDEIERLDLVSPSASHQYAVWPCELQRVLIAGKGSTTRRGARPLTLDLNQLEEGSCEYPGPTNSRESLVTSVSCSMVTTARRTCLWGELGITVNPCERTAQS